jgi:hypothetical protein
MILKPQDIFILLKLVALKRNDWSYSFLANELCMSPAEVHAGIKRASSAKLMDLSRKDLIKRSLQEFIIHGVKYAFPPTCGSITRGMPTCYAGPPLNDHFIFSEEMVPVWPDPEGEVRGYEFLPLYKSVPCAAKKDKELYELLVIVDTIRDGRARERDYAVKEIRSRIM